MRIVNKNDITYGAVIKSPSDLITTLDAIEKKTNISYNTQRAGEGWFVYPSARRNATVITGYMICSGDFLSYDLDGLRVYKKAELKSYEILPEEK